MTAPTDRELILRARRGDTEKYGELVIRYQKSVFNVCYRILHERGEAEDLAQESFMRAYDRLSTFDIERESRHRPCAKLLLGGHVDEGKVHGEWPRLEEGQMVGPGDLAVTTDYRDVLSEVLVKRLNNTATDEIFPDYQP